MDVARGTATTATNATVRASSGGRAARTGTIPVAAATIAAASPAS